MRRCISSFPLPFEPCASCVKGQLHFPSLWQPVTCTRDCSSGSPACAWAHLRRARLTLSLPSCSTLKSDVTP
eukprot:266869-Prymnesium_polylepis.2